MLDIDGLKQSTELLDIAGRYGIEMKPDGPGEHRGLCPFHSEKSPSFTITEGKGFYCFGCGTAGNNTVEFTRLMENLPDDGKGFTDAAKILADMVNYDQTREGAFTPAPRESAPTPEEIWQPTPALEDWDAGNGQTVTVFNPKRNSEYPINYVAAYPYHHPDGSLCGVILRTERDGRKQFQTITYRVNRDTGHTRWVVLAMPAPRPIYGADLIVKNPDAKILLVEGEKARHAAERLINSPKIIPVTWAGGSKAIEKTDWSPLAGRQVIAWPDCDSKTIQRGQFAGDLMPYNEQPGVSAMLKISELARANMKIVKVPNPGEISDGWDIADAEAEGWDRSKVMSYIKERATAPADLMPATESQIEEPPPFEPTDADLYPAEEIHFEDYVTDDDSMPPMPPAENLGNGDRFDDGVIKILGWDSGTSFYLTHSTKQLERLPAGSHTKLQLLRLAPLRYWMENYPDMKKNGPGVDWDMAADSLFRRCQQKGIFDPDKVRGRGAWFDAGRSVVHAGDRLVVNGTMNDLTSFDTDYIYPQAKPMNVTLETPMTNKDAVKFVDICSRIRWEDPISARLLAGWCFLAPICGAIDWRPHLWLTGPAGSGKSTVIYRIMKPVLGGDNGMMIHAAGDTTEAGLRQYLRQDALPVLFDEFESEREKAANRVDDVLALVRQSSSDTGAEIIKGGASGQAERFLIRSMFAFASIAVGMNGQADESRISVLSMKGLTKDEQQDPAIINQWIDLNKAIQETLTTEYIHQLQARAIKMIPVIRENIQTFSDAVARAPSLGGKRLGDQVGTLLAGCYSMFSEKPVTLDQAIDWIARQDWSGVSNADTDGDEMGCLMKIISHHVRAEGYNVAQTLTIAELIDISCMIDMGPAPDNIDGKIAEQTLNRFGIKCEMIDGAQYVLIASGHDSVTKIVKSDGHVGYHRILARMDGAIKTGTKRFAGVPKKAIALPLDMVRDDLD